MINDLEAVKKIVADYEALVARVVKVTVDGPYRCSVEFDDNPRLIFEGDEVVIQWKAYESDWYGGGHLSDEETRFPTKFLFMTDKEFADFLATFKKDEREKRERLNKAQEAVNRERVEARDRAEFARLSQKYGGGTK